MILSDSEIRALAEQGMITPFVPRKMREINGVPAISFGLGSFGYDVRVGNKFLVFDPSKRDIIVDPKNFTSEFPVITTDEPFILMPHTSALAESVEKFIIPDDIMVVVVGKSTYARCGVIINVTPGEPGWSGYWTIEIFNASHHPVRIYPYEGIMQALFFRGKLPIHRYMGAYQHQAGLMPPVVQSVVQSMVQPAVELPMVGGENDETD